MAHETHGTTAGGETITDGLIDELARKADAGFDVDEIVQRRNEYSSVGAAAAVPDLPGVPQELRRLTGEEALGLGTVREFWAWALGDLRMNNARGWLAEWLVARAVGDPRPIRVEWDGVDVMTADGIRIEVKATGRLQSWFSARPSTVRWTTRADSLKWDFATGRWSEDVAEHVPHVWVFALHTCIDHRLYDPLDLTQWEFRVAPHHTVAALGQQTAALSTIDRISEGPVGLDDVAVLVRATRQTGAEA